MEITKERVISKPVRLSWEIGLIVLLVILNLFHPSQPLNAAFYTLTGQDPFSDVAQDFYGFQAMINNWDTYPSLVDGFAMLGIDWNVLHASTHPPTAYLLTAPVALFPWPVSSALWGWLMLSAIITSLRLYGLPWWVCLSALLWPPVEYSLGQITPIWMLGLAIAYRNQDKPIKAGVWIAFASLTKFFPAIMLIPLLFRRKWSAVIGFVAVWLVALLIIFAISPNVVPRYVEINFINSGSGEQIGRWDNVAFLPTLLHISGIPGLVCGFVILLVFTWLGRKNWNTWEYLAVAMLPIAWIYSILPLLPGLLKQSNKIIAGFVLLIPLLVPSWSVITAITFVPLFILTGLLFLFPRQESHSNG